ncbi:annexin A8 isoform X2 [Homo sapiens]|uniref:annexin A8 isoform X2 n=1 Tax=Homo sapiens TaxID=9606 RepID=UPI0005D037ED|nr:annexin A8 isoform X2 [Homo sapiens]XP_054222598.1 annexin A8 isoform X2 [Homo sapiens]|eukprot:XP_011538400.1 annexin A8 isoform X2 [Homo sapiens]
MKPVHERNQECLPPKKRDLPMTSCSTNHTSSSDASEWSRGVVVAGQSQAGARVSLGGDGAEAITGLTVDQYGMLYKVAVPPATFSPTGLPSVLQEPDVWSPSRGQPVSLHLPGKGAPEVKEMAWWKSWIEQEGVTVKSSSHFNPDPDAETLYKAMKGIGTNEQAIIDVLTKRSNTQRQQIAKSFKAQFGKDLTETLKSELSGKFERLIVALMYPPYRYEAKELHDAMKGLGTKEGVIIEILASRTKNQLREIMKAYEEDYGSSLEEDIQADTSGYLERILVCLLQGSRDDVSSFVDPGLALQDAQDLYAAGEKIRGTDEMKFITILCTRSATHLLRVKCTQNLHSYFAERLYYAMKGAGTRDGTLIRNIVSRSEIDLNLIKCHFKKMYGKTLSSMIMEDTSGDYKNALLSLVGSDP